ncbi:hypothetical protein HMSSN036_64200 [Paenibacillus macerans]|nr:hypothetical protein HMSSN036_64200 [Paenibacillus macerans]
MAGVKIGYKLVNRFLPAPDIECHQVMCTGFLALPLALAVSSLRASSPARLVGSSVRGSVRISAAAGQDDE